MGRPKGHRTAAGEESFAARPGLLAEGDKNGFALLGVMTKLKIYCEKLKYPIDKPKALWYPIDKEQEARQ